MRAMVIPEFGDVDLFEGRLDEMSRLIERGQMRPLVDEVLPLNEVGKAHERLESGHGRGKVVLRVAEE